MIHARFALLLIAPLVLVVTKDAVAADNVPPAILATTPEPLTPGAPFRVTCDIVDESAIAHPTLYWRASGAGTFEAASMRVVGEHTYRAETPVLQGIPAIDWYLEAYDAEGNGPARFGSPTEPQHTEVPALAPPTQSLAPWLLTIAGVLAVGAGVVTLAATDHAIPGGVLAGVGAVSLAGGVVLFAREF